MACQATSAWPFQVDVWSSTCLCVFICLQTFWPDPCCNGLALCIWKMYERFLHYGLCWCTCTHCYGKFVKPRRLHGYSVCVCIEFMKLKTTCSDQCMSHFVIACRCQRCPTARQGKPMLCRPTHVYAMYILDFLICTETCTIAHRFAKTITNSQGRDALVTCHCMSFSNTRVFLGWSAGNYWWYARVLCRAQTRKGRFWSSVCWP